jgi:hypothetical protein
MKKVILVLVIYLIGCVCAYKYTKFNIINRSYHREWTKEDRTFSIVLSCFSWVTVCAMGIVHGVESIINDEKAEW